MKILLLGMGFVGSQVAVLLREAGHHVIGTTTTPDKVAHLQTLCERVLVLRGSESEKIRDAAHECDAVMVTVGPNLQRANNPATRAEEYRQALVLTCTNAAHAHAHCIFSSSLSVYGDGGAGTAEITENTPLTDSADVSPQNYKLAEAAVLTHSQGAVLRLPDVYGAARDLSYVERVKLGHTLMGGRVPFAPDALLYRIHYIDAARALVHALEKNLRGAYNVVDNSTLPPTNQAVFDRLADEAGVPHLEYTGRIRLPARKISAQKFLDTGFVFQHTDYVFR